MKSLMSLLVVANFFAPLATANADFSLTKEVIIGINDAYVPGGFSSDTDAFAVVSGTFPNSCYSWVRADVTNKSAMFHEIRSLANVTEAMCLMVIIPFSKEVRLGKLSSGEHTLRFISGDGTYFDRTFAVE